ASISLDRVSQVRFLSRHPGAPEPDRGVRIGLTRTGPPPEPEPGADLLAVLGESADEDAIRREAYATLKDLVGNRPEAHAAQSVRRCLKCVEPLNGAALSCGQEG